MRTPWSMTVGLGSTLGLAALLMLAATSPALVAQRIEGDGSLPPSPRAGANSRKHPDSLPGRAGEVREARMADLIDQAVYVGPNPRQAYFGLRSHWLKMVDPYGNLSAGRSFLRLKVAFLVPDVAHYLDPRHPRGRSFLGGGERTWSYSHGVYESRLAIFAPVESRRLTTFTFPVRPRDGSLLRFGVGGVPKRRGGGHLEFWIDLHAAGKRRRLWSRTLGPAEMLNWHEDRVALGPVSGGNARIVFGCRGEGAHGLWLDPVIWAPGRVLHDNVLFVVVDTMRPDAIHALGGKWARTPNMDRLVHEGTAFTRFFTNGSWTRASIVSFFSANYASSVGLTPDKFIFPSGVREAFYRRRLPQLPAHMERLGYSVAAVVNNFFGLPYTAVGVDHGFSRFTDVRHPRLDSRAITRAAVQFLQRNRNRPFFLYVHYEALHDYDHRPDYWASKFPVPGRLRMDKYWRAYLSLGARVDSEVGKLVAALKHLGLRRHTLVVLTADHGEVFDKRHDFYIPFFRTKTLHQHARAVWDEVLHIPMVWSMPGRVPEGARVAVQLRAVDLFPSVLDFLGLPPMGRLEGRSFSSLIAGSGTREDQRDRQVYSEGFHIRALRQGGFKYVFRDRAADRFQVGRRMVTRPEELFDLGDDPDEVRDVAGLHPGRVARMRETMRRVQQESLPEHLDSGAVSDTEGIVHFRFCSSAKRMRRLHLVLWSEGQGTVTLAGARGEVFVRPLSAEKACIVPGTVSGRRKQAGRACGASSTSGLSVDLVAKKDCSGLAVALSGPLGFRATHGRKVLHPGEIKVGPFGLPFLSSTRIDPSDRALVSPEEPASLDEGRPGLFVWTNHRTSAYQDPLTARRALRSDSLVRMNLLRGGYVKSPEKSR